MHSIIQANTSHLNQLAQLFDMYRIFYNKASDIDKGQAFLHERLIRLDSTLFISTENNIVSGFVQLYPIFSSTKMQRLWLLNDLFVHPTYRGLGLSKKLIEHCKEYCTLTKACGLILETAKTNEIGNKLYPSLDFKLDTEHNYYAWDHANS